MAFASNPYLKGRYAVDSVAIDDVNVPVTREEGDQQQGSGGETNNNNRDLTDEMIQRAEKLLQNKLLFGEDEIPPGSTSLPSGNSQGNLVDNRKWLTQLSTSSAASIGSAVVGTNGETDDVAQKLTFAAVVEEGDRTEAVSRIAQHNSSNTIVDDTARQVVSAHLERRGPNSDDVSSSTSDEGRGYGDVQRGFAIPTYSMVEQTVFAPSSSTGGAAPQQQLEGDGVCVSPTPSSSPSKSHPPASMCVDSLLNQNNDYAEPVEGSGPIVPSTVELSASPARNQSEHAILQGNNVLTPVRSPSSVDKAAADRISSVVPSPSRRGSSPSSQSPQRSSARVGDTPGIPVALPAAVSSLSGSEGVGSTRAEVDEMISQSLDAMKQAKALLAVPRSRGSQGSNSDAASSRTISPTKAKGFSSTAESAPSEGLGARSLKNQNNDYALPASEQEEDEEPVGPGVRSLKNEEHDYSLPVQSNVSSTSVEPRLAISPVKMAQQRRGGSPPSAPLSSTIRELQPSARLAGTSSRALTAQVTTATLSSSSALLATTATPTRTIKLKGRKANIAAPSKQIGGSHVVASKTKIEASSSSPSMMSSCRRRHLTGALREQGAQTPMIERVVRGSSLDGSFAEPGEQRNHEHLLIPPSSSGQSSSSSATLTPVSSDSEGGDDADFSLADDTPTQTPHQKHHGESSDSAGEGRNITLSTQQPAHHQFFQPTTQLALQQIGSPVVGASASAVTSPSGLPPRSGSGSPVQVGVVPLASSPTTKPQQSVPSALAPSNIPRYDFSTSDRRVPNHHPHNSEFLEVPDATSNPQATVEVHTRAATVGNSAPIAAASPTEVKPGVGLALLNRRTQDTSSERPQPPAVQEPTKNITSAPEEGPRPQTAESAVSSTQPPRHRSRTPPKGVPRYLLPTSSWEAKGVVVRDPTVRRRPTSSRNGNSGGPDGRWPYPLPDHRATHEPDEHAHSHAVHHQNPVAGSEVMMTEGGEGASGDVESAQQTARDGISGLHSDPQRGTWQTSTMVVGKYKNGLGSFNRHAMQLKNRLEMHDRRGHHSSTTDGPASGQASRRVVGVSELARVV